ncbi:hypothetical protein [Methylocystis parvus]|uniref:Uncharacterized protein n=1 Tax=Methylocystis parvus TaxID=134 RepID=A0A6B8M3P8_9HYPH|nr:hypothetical protein [Methylocystis parvus]QGM96369.1 hypothetical protein F7D14_01950 [Methylocystis parvus]WBJ99790.1 hypothetical protein MMG94_17675 [Methylocystis parvus OBBP]
MSATSFNQNYQQSSYGPLRARPAGVKAATGMGLGASVILAAAALLLRHPAQTPLVADNGPAASLEAPAKISAKATTELESALGGKPAVASLDVDAPEFEHEKKIVAVGETRNGAPRVDSLTVGQFTMGAPFLRVDVHPELDPKTTNADFFLDMKNHAQAAGLNVAKIGQRATLTTRFGAFEAADIRLAQASGEGVEASERACLAARMVEAKVPLEIAGIACGAAAKPIDRVAFSCLLDKLSYSAGGDNKALNDFFLNAELARGKGCANVSRDDLTAAIPPQRAARAKSAAAPGKKGRAVARSASVHPEAAKN